MIAPRRTLCRLPMSSSQPCSEPIVRVLAWLLAFFRKKAPSNTHEASCGSQIKKRSRKPPVNVTRRSWSSMQHSGIADQHCPDDSCRKREALASLLDDRYLGALGSR